MQPTVPPEPVPNVVAQAPAVAPAAASSSVEPTWLAPAVPRRRWYGWQTLIVDVADLAVWSVALQDKSEALAWLGLGTYLLGPPAVHFAHGHGEKALGDFGLRVALPVTLAALGYIIGGDSCPKSEGWFSFCIPPGILFGAVGGLIGYSAAVVIDAAVLAREDVGILPARVTARPFQWSPAVGPSPHGMTAGIRGSF